MPHRSGGEGLVTATEGGVIDYTRIYEDITTRIVPRFPLLKQATLGYDPAFATDLATQLRDRAGLKVAEVLQNYSHLSEPAQVFEALVKAGRVTHGGHRVLRHHVENVPRTGTSFPGPSSPHRRGGRVRRLDAQPYMGESTGGIALW